jgi:hypothetical protein
VVFFDAQGGLVFGKGAASNARRMPLTFSRAAATFSYNQPPALPRRSACATFRIFRALIPASMAPFYCGRYGGENRAITPACCNNR